MNFEELLATGQITQEQYNALTGQTPPAVDPALLGQREGLYGNQVGEMPAPVSSIPQEQPNVPPSPETFQRFNTLANIPDAARIEADDILSPVEQQQISKDAAVFDPMERVNRFQNADKLAQQPPVAPQQQVVDWVDTKQPSQPSQQLTPFELDESGLRSAVSQQQSAIDAGMAAEQEGNALVANMFENASREITATKEQLAQLQSKKEEAINKELAKLDEFKKTKLDPRRWWNSQSDEAKVGLVIAAALNGFSTGFTGRGENYALNAINNAINKDLRSQANLLERGLTVQGKILGETSKKFADKQDALVAGKIMMLDKIKADLDATKARTASQLVKSNADKLKADLQVQMESELLKLQSQVGLKANAALQKQLQEQAKNAYATGVVKDINTRIKDPKQQKLALEELQGNQSVDKGIENVRNIEKVIASLKWNPLIAIPGTEDNRKFLSTKSAIESAIVQAFRGLGAFSDQDRASIQGAVVNQLDTFINNGKPRFEGLYQILESKRPPTPVLDGYNINYRFGASQGNRVSSAAPQQSAPILDLDERQPTSEKSSLVDTSTIAPKDPLVRQDIKNAIATAAGGDKPLEDMLFVLANRESRFDPNAKNPNSTATGMFQFIESTGESVGLVERDASKKIIRDDRKDYWKAAQGAAKLVKEELQRFAGSPLLVSAAYYAGPSAVKEGLILGQGKLDETKIPYRAILQNKAIKTKPEAEKIWKHAVAYANDIISELGVPKETQFAGYE